MCGIAGVISADGSESGSAAVEQAVRHMMAAMAHRGPDDAGYLQTSIGGEPIAVCGLGFRRLAIMDLSPLGHQPMIDQASGNAIIFNGEIYNAPDLREQLRGRGVVFTSTSDTEVLLQSLTVWGDAALARLDGMFAFAFYESASRRLLLARDPLGIKPLYIGRTRGALVFASEIRAVLASGLVPTDLDPAGIATTLAYGAPQDPLTIHRFIRSFPSASCQWLDDRVLHADDAGSRPRRYWSFPPSLREAHESAAVATVRERLEESVRRQCVADVPVGVFLSAGIDSGAIAALAASAGFASTTFTVGFDAPGADDERAVAAQTAAFVGAVHHEIVVTDEVLLTRWREWLAAADRPSIDGFNTFVVSRAVRERGIAVALSGLGSDEFFGGYPAFWQAPPLARAARALGWLPADCRRTVARASSRLIPVGKREKLADLLASGHTLLEAVALYRRVLSDAALQSLGFVPRELGLLDSYLPPAALAGWADSPGDSFQQVSRAEAMLYMGNTLLRDADINGMANSLEIRVPFLGQRVVDYVSSLPGVVQSPRGTPHKHLLREAVAASLPSAVFARGKTGFTLPFSAWMAGPLREQSQALVDVVAGCPFLSASAVKAAWDGYMSPEPPPHWSRAMSLVSLGNALTQCHA
jgi:asparagine synthase (glutamine-hydrolysing)